MLPSIMPEASVLHFPYSDPPKVDIDWKGFVKALATQLTTKLEEQVTVQKKAPLLFIGHGIGGPVVQEAAVQRASGLNILQESGCGLHFSKYDFSKLSRLPPLG
jgi:hypothetical protein